MKQFFSLLTLLLLAINTQAQSMRVVIDSSGEVVGRLVSINARTYTVSVQDDYDVPKAGNRVVTYSAAQGQGIVYRNAQRTGNIRVRQQPSTSSTVVAIIPEDDGIPQTFPCLGKVNNWYKIKIKGKIGYLRADMASWDAIDTF